MTSYGKCQKETSYEYSETVSHIVLDGDDTAGSHQRIGGGEDQYRPETIITGSGRQTGHRG